MKKYIATTDIYFKKGDEVPKEMAEFFYPVLVAEEKEVGRWKPEDGIYYYFIDHFGALNNERWDSTLADKFGW